MLIKDYSSTTYVTGMRAFAALWVLLIHAGGGGLRGLGVLGDSFVDFGRGGVYAFFVISGFSVSASYAKAGGYRRYLFLRFMRLAPLYYFYLLVFGLLLQRGGGRAEVLGLPGLPLDLGLHLSFLHPFYVPAANTFIGVEWSLGVEMFWYLLLPGLLWLSLRGKGPWVAGLGFLSYFALHVLFGGRASTDLQVKLALLWNPLSYFFSFALGVWAFVLRPAVAPRERGAGVVLALGLLAAYIVAPVFTGRNYVDLVLVASLVTFLLLVYGSNEDAVCRWVFLSRPVLIVGTLSYGLYLVHYPVINALEPVFGSGAAAWRAIAAAALSLGAAWLTYVLIEEPSQRWAKRFFPL